LRSVVKVEASIRACGFVGSKVLRHQVSGLMVQVHSSENMWRSDLAGASSSSNPSLGWRRVRRVVARTSKQIICVCDCFLSHSLLLILYYCI